VRTFLAPGKIVLLGEYAVLDGAPALVTAVDRGVRCEVSEAEARSWSVPDDDRFVAAALAHAPPGHYAFSAWNPPPTGTKPGLGTSAAAVVCALAAAQRVAPLPRQQLFTRALAAHRAVQGSGSGVDVAASTWGGVLSYAAEQATPVPLPEALEISLVWSGSSSSTGPRVQLYLAWAKRGPFTEASARIVARFPADPLGAVRSNRRLLVRMAAATGLEYQTPALDRIVSLARDHGGAAKPSGAGGGDSAVALFTNPDDRLAFEVAAHREGLHVIPVSISPGAREVG